MTRRGSAACLLAIAVTSGCGGGRTSSGPAPQSHAPPPGPAEGRSPELPAVTVEPALLSGAAADIGFWATLRNPQGPRCSPLFVDTAVSDRKPDLLLSPRPTTVISLEIRDERGHAVEPRWRGGIRYAALRAQQLVLLECAQGYSWQVHPARVPWGYALTPGRYVARITLLVPMASFVKWHLTLENEVVALWPSFEQTELRYLRDVATEAAEVGFVVEQ